MREENLQNVNISKKSLNLAFKNHTCEVVKFSISFTHQSFFPTHHVKNQLILFKVHSLKERRKIFLVNKIV